MGDPAQRQQQCHRRALSRLHHGESELAVPELPAPPPGGCAVGRQARRRRGVVLVRERVAAIGQGPVRAGPRHAQPGGSRQCRAPGARSLAQRCHVGGDGEQHPRPVWPADLRRRPQGADGHSTVWQRARGRVACGPAPRRRPCRPGQSADRDLPQGAQQPRSARCGAARAARRRRLHFQPDPAAATRREVCRGGTTDAERAEGSGTPAQSRRMVDRATAAVAQDDRHRRVPQRLSDRP